MAGDIFGHRLDADVDPVGEGTEGQTGPPGIVHHRQDAAGATGSGQGGDILNLEGQGGRRLDQQDTRFGGQGLDHGLDRGIGGMETGVYAPGRHMPRQEPTAWAVDGVRGQNLVTGPGEGGNRDGDGGET